MKFNLTFTENDFNDMRSFEKALTRQLGTNLYVGTDSCCVYFDYPKELKAMLRPFPPEKKLEFVLESSKP